MLKKKSGLSPTKEDEFFSFNEMEIYFSYLSSAAGFPAWLRSQTGLNPFLTCSKKGFARPA